MRNEPKSTTPGIVSSDDLAKKPGPQKKHLGVSLLAIALVSLLLAIVLAIERHDQRIITSEPTPKVSNTAEVSITANSFVPATLKVKVGTKVTWTNQEDQGHWVAANPYPTHSELPGLNAGQKMTKGVSYSYTFDTPGTYNYHDDLAPILNGTVIVE